jgi:hypothetical protein
MYFYLMPKKILVAPLDWGLGHATRCVPLIRALLANGHTVLLGVTPLTEKILGVEFPQLQRFQISATEIEYSTYLPVWASILLDYNRLKKVVKEETTLAEKIVKEHGVDVIISDNRYGFFCKGIKNIFITHQLWIKSPVMEKTANSMNHTYMKNFDEVWVPDLADDKLNLTGELAHGKKPEVPVHYIGVLSRFKQRPADLDRPYQFTFLISGAEPKRSLFEEEVVHYLNIFRGKFALVRGTDKKLDFIMRNLNCDVFDLPDKDTLEKVIANSRMIVSRSGYSTVMDLVTMQRPAFFYPTTGQTEQTYLAGYLNGKYGFKRINAVEEISITPHTGMDKPFDVSASEELLKKTIAGI